MKGKLAPHLHLYVLWIRGLSEQIIGLSWFIFLLYTSSRGNIDRGNKPAASRLTGSNKDAPTFPVQVAEEERRAVIGQRPQRRGLEEDTELYIKHILHMSLMWPYEPSRGCCRCVSPESGVGSSIPANRPQRSWLL